MVSIWITLLSLDSDSAFPMALEMKGTLRGVVIIVVFRPFPANSLAMSMVGMIWPCAKKGMKNTCKERTSLLIFFSSKVSKLVELLHLN